MSPTERILFYLHELPDYQVASDYSDVTGWDVIDAQQRTVGKVANLLVNKVTERVVYLDVEVDKEIIEEGYKTYQVPASEGIHGFMNKEGEDHLIVPIGMVGLDEENKKVHSSRINYDTFARVKRFTKGSHINKDYEFNVYRHYMGDSSIDDKTLNESFYNRKEFENYLRDKKQKADS